MSTTDFGGQLDDLRQRLVAFDSVLEKCGDLLPEAGRLSTAARTRLARYALRRAYRAYDRGRTEVVPVAELEASPPNAFRGTPRSPSTVRCAGAGGSGPA